MADFRMYAACLASYNNGVLHDVWIDLDGKDADEINGEIAVMLRGSPHPNVHVDCQAREGFGFHLGDSRCTGGGDQLVRVTHPCATCKNSGKVPSAEEWAAHDWEGGGLSDFGEYPDLSAVVEHIERVEEHGDAWLAYVSCVGAGYATEEGFRDSYQGSYDSEEAWAEALLDETGALEGMPEALRCYFDYERYARDARLGGDISFEIYEGTLYVFSNH